MTNLMVNEFKEHDKVSVQLLVVSATRGASNNGQSYLSMELRDSSSSINAKKWDSTPEEEKITVAGNVIHVDAEVILYKDNLQLKVLTITPVNENDVDVSRFVKNPPIPKEELKKRFLDKVMSVNESTCRQVLEYFVKKFKDKVFDYPAASSIHHEYASGLIMHSLSMAEIGDFLVKQYPNINRDILITGCLLHDFGKMIELEGPIVYHYSLKGKLLGHISIMSSELGKAFEELKLDNEVTTLLQHMVLSHHGQNEFGSPVIPQTREALLLSLIDNIDSKMVITEKALENVEEGGYSNKVYPLDGRIFYQPKK